ncbi:class I SAM-dependent methyltransferase [Bifidobacterium phasiani]|uniref:Class I SAM-dependent methyltransferase n=1 Tax=Bifidobacterium phasiani TaxID=2834431 RepID=A0ABS6W673_9BIFI|nr:class I SAM-dependent methyltransferase [Bifidobacterium phasiani]MBW3081942.1 class I SAM-dependent methyltransferase [Bifidobacterium phasiani]
MARENRYDDAEFYGKYGRMARSRQGLEGAGEWRALRAMLPDFHGARVLDLGCGYGWHCKYAADHGAASVLGVDISRRMLEHAREINADPAIEYRRAAMEDVEAPDASFDVVLSSLAFHYVEDFAGLMRRIARWLRPGGTLVFSVEHPVFTAYGSQDWWYGPDGEILHFPVDRYYYEGEREAVFLGEKVVKYHRTLTTYLGALPDNGFEITRVVEPMPPEDMIDLPGMRDEMRRPMMLLVSGVRR